MTNPRVRRRKLLEARLEIRLSGDDYKRYANEAAKQNLTLAQWARGAFELAYTRGATR